MGDCNAANRSGSVSPSLVCIGEITFYFKLYVSSRFALHSVWFKAKFFLRVVFCQDLISGATRNLLLFRPYLDLANLLKFVALPFYLYTF